VPEPARANAGYTGPWEFEFPFPGSLTSTFLNTMQGTRGRCRVRTCSRSKWCRRSSRASERSTTLQKCAAVPRRARISDSCITQLKAQGLSRTCNESKEEDTGLLPSADMQPEQVVQAILQGLRKVNHSTEMCSGSEAGSYFRLIDSSDTQLKAQGPVTRVKKKTRVRCRVRA